MTALPSSSFGGGDIWANGPVTLPQYSSRSTFAERARRRKADLQAQGMISPPPGLGIPTPAARNRTQSRDPSPGFYGLDGRSHKKPLLPINPSLAPAGNLLSPTSPSPIPRTPSPPAVHRPSNDLYEPQQHSAIPLPRTNANGHSHYPHSAPAGSVAPSTTSSTKSTKTKRNVIRKKSSAHHTSASANNLRTGSTTSANVSNASVTTSTSASRVGRENYQQPSILGTVPVPSTSYATSTSVTPTPPSSYKPPRADLNGSVKRAGPSGLPTPQPFARTNRSGSGGQQALAPGSNRLSIPSISQHLSNKPSPRLSTANLPSPITVPAVATETTSTSSPSTGYCGSPGMFSYASTPTSSSTNPSSLQSPGFPPFGGPRPALIRNGSSTGLEGGGSHTPEASKIKPRDPISSREGKHVGPYSSGRANVRMSVASTSSTSTVRPESRRSASLGSTTQLGLPKPGFQPQHIRKASKESNGSKSGSSGPTSFGFHLRKSSKDSTSKVATSSASHSRKSSKDSTNTGSVNASSSSLISGSAPIPIPSKVRAPPPRPSREGAPDISSDNLGHDTNVVIQSGIVAFKDSRSRTPKMTIPASTSLPHKRNGPFAVTPGTTPPATSLSTSIPNRSKSVRLPTPTTAKGAKVVHGFSAGASSGSNAAASSSKQSDTSLSPRKKKDEKKSVPEGNNSSTTSLTRPSLFGTRGRTKTVPGPAEKVLPTVSKRPGPAAGTGHEGYSQFGKAPRTRSLSGSSLPAPASKISSITSTPNGSLSKSTGSKLMSSKGADMDGFLQGRLEPVVIQGGGIIQKNISRSTSPYEKNKKTSESQKSSLEISRPLPISRGSASLDLPRTERASSERPSITNGIPKVVENKVSGPQTSGTLPKAMRTSAQIFDSSYHEEEDFWPSEKDPSWLKGSKRLAPPAVTAPIYSPKWWEVFRKSPSAPEVGKTEQPPAKPQTSTSAKHSPQLSQDAKFSDGSIGSQAKEVPSPPLRDQQTTRRDSKGYADALRKQNHFHDLLLPDPPSLPRPVKATVQSAPLANSSIAKAQVPTSKIAQPSHPRAPATKSGLRPPQVQAPPSSRSQPGPSGTSQQKSLAYGSQLPSPHQPSQQSQTHFLIPDAQNSASMRTIRVPPGLPIPSALAPTAEMVPIIFPQVGQAITSPDPFVKNGGEDVFAPETFRFVPDSLEDSPEPQATNLRTEAEADRSRSSSSCEVRLPTSAATPSPRATPRPKLKAIGRIPTPGATQNGGPAFELPTLAQILPPPPSLPSARQSPKIEPPKRMAHPQYIPDTQDDAGHGEYDEHEDYEDDYYDDDDYNYDVDNNDGGPEPSSRRPPFAELPPLVITEDMNNTRNKKRVSDSGDDWNEYDDYLDEMSGTPKRAKTRSQTSSLNSPFPYSHIATKFNADVERERKGKGKDNSTSVNDSPTLPSQAVFPTVVQFPPSNKKKLVLDKSKLSAARPLAARPTFSPAVNPVGSLFSPGQDMDSIRSSSSYSIPTPGTPGTPRMIPFADFIAAYAESGTKVMSVVDPLQEKPKSLYPQQNGLLSPQNALLSPMSSATDFEDDSNSDNDSARQSIISALSNNEDAIEGEMKVRLWALMTSRWLSGGRVLLSPAHEEMRVGGPSSRILVVDGLGNDDWSFYCSLNYLNAVVYNLTLSQAPSPMSPAGETAQPPPNNPNNHHQIHYTGFASPFPFPSGFFSVVSFRFLPASVDALWPFIISQCIRVLRPGGYMELSVMDLDMSNMGPRTTRTVDMIKDSLHKLQTGNGSDWFRRSPTHKALKLMATRGFVDITRCRVGIPTVGNVDGSREERASMQQILREGASDDTDMNSAEGINRVVSKVGRWWYNKCFEDFPQNDEDEQPEPKFKRSIWDDNTLLRECEKRKTCFRILISYAKKPMDWREV